MSSREPEAAENAGRATLARGGTIRVGGYAAGFLASLIAVPLLTRHLGVEQYGRYITVTSLIAVTGLVVDLGLTTVGVRAYVNRRPEARMRLLSTILATRLTASTLGGVIAVGVAAALGLSGDALFGAALAGIGLILAMTQQTMAVALLGDLRFLAATSLDLARQVLAASFIAFGVLVGAGLPALLGATIPTGMVIWLLTVRVVERIPRPSFDAGEIRRLLREAVWAATASILASVFYRTGALAVAAFASPREVGLYGVSARVVEALVAVPSLVMGTVYPALARAAATDERRLAQLFRDAFLACSALGGLVAVGASLGAPIAVAYLGGPEFREAVPILRLQGAALALTFVAATFTAALWVTDEKRALVGASVTGLVLGVVLSGILVPTLGGFGAALGFLVAEFCIVGFAAVGLLRSRPELRPRLGAVLVVLLALGAGYAALLLPWGPWAQLAAGTVAYATVLLLHAGLRRQLVASAGPLVRRIRRRRPPVRD